MERVNRFDQVDVQVVDVDELLTDFKNCLLAVASSLVASGLVPPIEVGLGPPYNLGIGGKSL